MCGMAAGSGEDLYSRIGSHCAVITCADGAHSKRSDMLGEGVYKDYKDFSGVKFPTMIIEKQGGFPVLILVVSDVKPNGAVGIPSQQTETQQAGQGGPVGPVGPAQAAAVQSEKVADGVFYLRGGTH